MKNDFEKTADLINSENKKAMFEAIKSFNNLGSTLVMFEEECSTTFCQDIAKRAHDQYRGISNSYTEQMKSRLGYSSNEVRLSDKQAWCLVFDVLKNVHMYEAWVEKIMAELENEEI